MRKKGSDQGGSPSAMANAEEVEALARLSGAPCVDGVIGKTMLRFPSIKGRYFEEVHQVLAPLARRMEIALRGLLDEVEQMESNRPSPVENRRALIQSARSILSGEDLG